MAGRKSIFWLGRCVFVLFRIFDYLIVFRFFLIIGSRYLNRMGSIRKRIKIPIFSKKIIFLSWFFYSFQLFSVIFRYFRLFSVSFGYFRLFSTISGNFRLFSVISGYSQLFLVISSYFRLFSVFSGYFLFLPVIFGYILAQYEEKPIP